MPSDDPDDFSFAEEMARLGVVPMPGDKRARSADGDRKSERKNQRKKAAASPGPQGDRRGQRPEPRQSEPSRQSELDRARHTLASERRDWEAERQKWLAERDRWLAERNEWLARDERWQKERQAMRQKIDEARRASESRVSLRAVLHKRGCLDPGEVADVLRRLLDVRAEELVDAIELASPNPLAQILEDRVVLVAQGLDLESMDLDPDATCAILRVTPERCEITGGSDIRAEFHRFVDACRKSQVQRITIVGGSPAYRKQLRLLASPHQKVLRLDLIMGNRRRERRRAESDVRSSDLVVIWGATELDHSVSDVYTQSQTPVLRVPHRGISRMLHHVAEAIQKGDRVRTGQTRTGGSKSRGAGKPRKPKRRR